TNFESTSCKALSLVDTKELCASGLEECWVKKYDSLQDNSDGRAKQRRIQLVVILVRIRELQNRLGNIRR
ncbi:MAG: hypothetical protein ACI87A_001548, partial [Planctomycetota bacterium]